MPSPVTTQPRFVDGNSALTRSVASCVNLNQNYLYSDDSIGEKGMHNQVGDPAGQAIGSFTQASGFFAGNVTLQLNDKDDPLPRVGYVLLMGGSYYAVTDVSPKNARGKAVTFTVAVEKILNPVITSLLTTLGQLATATGTGTSYTGTAPTVANTRTGATLAWSLSAWTEEYPSATVPAGLTINSSTGALTGTTVAAGTYPLKLTVTDTVTGTPTPPVLKGVAYLILTLS